ncbi:hypothetical protein I7I53_09897 [Histoplasma capsulatum var. duboisii H88]|uniref:Uncharacterized protein n=1 Tax=Ajellomyces capsulatus (strain H88) TaxID=544711 RepID=A0A8A1L7K5_AJEC8|nr:hypothetical protein I7I53_09897 [Histoplasma capsulatum var. duboisii H88]
MRRSCSVFTSISMLSTSMWLKPLDAPAGSCNICGMHDINKFVVEPPVVSQSTIEMFVVFVS